MVVAKSDRPEWERLQYGSEIRFLWIGKLMSTMAW